MAYVVCEPCYDCKYTDCVTVCPLDCFYQDEHMLYINPADCIDCDACAPECPVEAIYQEAGVPSRWTPYIQLNAERVLAAQTGATTTITQKQEPLPGSHCGRPKAG
jgi:ferredoxin